MSDTSRARPLAETLAAMAALTPAQHALLERISHHATPVTVAELAQEAGLHVSSVRETLEGLFALGLVEKQQLPSSGRGRPALGQCGQCGGDGWGEQIEMVQCGCRLQ